MLLARSRLLARSARNTPRGNACAWLCQHQVAINQDPLGKTAVRIDGSRSYYTMLPRLPLQWNMWSNGEQLAKPLVNGDVASTRNSQRPLLFVPPNMWRVGSFSRAAPATETQRKMILRPQ